MKQLTLLLFTLLTISVVSSCRKKGELPKNVKLDTELLVDTTEVVVLDSAAFNFGELIEGDKAEHTFQLVNTGSKNFVISRAEGSCGCTVPEYPKDPVAPGDTASIKVTFNSAGKHDEQNKTVTVHCNVASRSLMLYMKGFVKKKDAQ
ncbi:MAG: DUF1573 domain-containing protein [Chitinophagales bacterium]|jgi:hypothetical protein|nr:DUF1573 domain-containing protein [Chitinophagales bacterium]